MRKPNTKTPKLVSLLIALVACGAPSSSGPNDSRPPGVVPDTNKTSSPPQTVYDVDRLGYPKLVRANYIDLSYIRTVSYFRSGFGHDYSDARESCRSMKHYFIPANNTPAGTIRIFAPWAGEVVRTMEEWAGTQIHIRSDSIPAITAILFHVTPDAPVTVGQRFTAGQRIGTHVGPMTASDIAIELIPPTKERRLVSYFYLLDDGAWSAFRARGLMNAEAVVFTKEQRDAAPLTCNGEAFVGQSVLPDFVQLSGS